ncbi:DUF3164 family protein [Psychrobacter fulvigenes]|uniref:DUF3164 family protein n=1 Tax=Psychrobacter fulvigenes TaxID=533323 RepID=UPI002234AC40|nr:DUF3164 family protein [Psychrobacter fulvigenes]
MMNYSEEELKAMSNPTTESAPVTPDGYMTNAKGHLIPVDKVKPVDKLRDEVVKDMVAIAVELRAQMRTAKSQLFDTFNDFVALSAQEYDVQMGGKKGNTTLLSYDGKLKIQLAVSENIVFDERLQVAKSLIDECLTDWTQDSNDNIKALINQAFQVDKEGNISTGRVLALRGLDISDSKWDKAMDAISDAIQVTDTKQYIRFYERDSEGAYYQISLDFSNV